MLCSRRKQLPQQVTKQKVIKSSLHIVYINILLSDDSSKTLVVAQLCTSVNPLCYELDLSVIILS